jgi:deoxycytidine triphosphate deaminase
MNIDPLDKSLKGGRYLNDRGILQAIDFGFINIYPSIDFSKEKTRLQPATLDMKLSHVEDTTNLTHENQRYYQTEKTMLPARSYNEIILTEQITHNYQVPEYAVPFIFPFIEGRSSIRRLGCYVPHNGGLFMTQSQGTLVEINNYSSNNITFDADERVVQTFFGINPFKDELFKGFTTNILDLYTIKVPDLTTKQLHETFEKARSLEMGIEITTEEQLAWLVKEGYLQVRPKLISEQGTILIHASKNASTINTIEEGIIFSKRKEYVDRLHKPLLIKKDYTIKPYEHIDIETIESFKLSEHIGIQFYNNPTRKFLDELHKNPSQEMTDNLELTNMIDGWVDPCYEGPFSRQPKWFTNALVKPGDVIGFGKVIFYPQGVQRGYGSEELGSQYLKAKAQAIAKTS